MRVCGRAGYMLVSLIRPHGTSLEVYIPMMVVRTVMMVGVHTYNAYKFTHIFPSWWDFVMVGM